MSLKTFLLFTFIFASCSSIKAQEHDQHTGEEHEFKHHRFAVIIGHGHVIGAETVENGKSIATIPTWGFDYQYWINSKFGVGLKSDIEIMDYVIYVEGEGQLVRNNPIILSTVFLYHPAKGWNFMIGPGIEFDESHNLFVLRTGIAYEFEFANHWDFSPEVLFDVKDGSIGAFTWGIGVGKRF